MHGDPASRPAPRAHDTPDPDRLPWMSLTMPSGARDAPDVASAVRVVAREAGQRPAMTLLAPGGRQEQSFTSVAQWVSKTAHWLELELLLEPDDRLGLVGPPGWVPAVAALGAWWAGLTVLVGDDAPTADVVLAHAHAVPATQGELVVWGWAFDGTPTDDGPTEAFTRAVQPFPDDPPPPRGTAPSPALDDGGEVATQGAMLDTLRDASGATVGVPAESTDWLATAAIRPLLTARPTLILAPGVDRDAAEGDRVRSWI